MRLHPSIAASIAVAVLSCSQPVTAPDARGNFVLVGPLALQFDPWLRQVARAAGDEGVATSFDAVLRMSPDPAATPGLDAVGARIQAFPAATDQAAGLYRAAWGLTVDRVRVILADPSLNVSH